MKKYLYIILASIAISIVSCKPTKESVSEFDMSEFCSNYYVLVFPKNRNFHVFINKDNPDERFIIRKNMNYQNSGYGYSYAYYPDIEEMLKNGTYDTPEEAIMLAKENRPTRMVPFWLSQISDFGRGEWMIQGGDLMRGLCDE